MARIQPVLTASETALVDQMAALTQSKKTDVVKNALTVYHWFLRQTIAGNRVVSRKANGEEFILETAELAILEGRNHLLSPKELGLLAGRLAETDDATEAAGIKERLTRGFYGI